MDTNNNPAFAPVNANPMKNKTENPAVAENRKKENAGNVAKVAAGMAAGAGIAFGAHAAADFIPTDNVADAVLDQAANAANALHTTAPAYQPAGDSSGEILSDELDFLGTEENENEEEEFDVDDIKIELDDDGSMANLADPEKLPNVFDVDPSEIIYAEDYGTNGLPDDPSYQPDLFVDSQEVPEIPGDDLAFDDSNDIVDIL